MSINVCVSVCDIWGLFGCLSAQSTFYTRSYFDPDLADSFTVH